MENIGSAPHTSEKGGYGLSPSLRRSMLLYLSSVVALMGCSSNEEEGEKQADSVRSVATAGEGGLPKDGSVIPGGKKWALLVGVEDYANINKLKYCVDDAHLMHEALTGNCGFEKDNVFLMTDDASDRGMQPYAANVRTRLREVFSLVKENDTVVFYFSGHGDRQGKNTYLLTLDTDGRDVSRTSVHVKEIRDQIDDCLAQRKLVILDACHSGGSRSISGKGPSSSEIAEAFRGAKGTFTIASCQPEEESLEWGEKEHGLFTHYLAQGLEGFADRDRDKVVDVDELYRYVYDKVSSTSLRISGKVQRPARLIPEGTPGVLPIAKLPESVSIPHIDFSRPMNKVADHIMINVPELIRYKYGDLIDLLLKTDSLDREKKLQFLNGIEIMDSKQLAELERFLKDRSGEVEFLEILSIKGKINISKRDMEENKELVSAILVTPLMYYEEAKKAEWINKVPTLSQAEKHALQRSLKKMREVMIKDRSMYYDFLRQVSAGGISEMISDKDWLTYPQVISALIDAHRYGDDQRFVRLGYQINILKEKGGGQKILNELNPAKEKFLKEWLAGWYKWMEVEVQNAGAAAGK